MTKLALTIGINTYGHGADLSGCVNDAADWGAALTARDYRVTSLTDGNATKANIVAAIAELVGRTVRGDSLVVTYSGHGSWEPDLNGDEVDGRDEGLCPVDLWDAGLLLDDHLYDLFAKRAYGVRAVMISDSCHSGTVSRFAPPLRPLEVEIEGKLDEVKFRRPRFLPPSQFLDGPKLERARSMPRLLAIAPPRYPNLLMAGCADYEYSYDAWFGNRANGAFTRAALDALPDPALEQPDIGLNYRGWFRAIRTSLPSIDFPDQTPQLYGTSTQKDWRVLG